MYTLTYDKDKISLFSQYYNLDNAQLMCSLTTCDILHSSNITLPLESSPVFFKSRGNYTNERNTYECREAKHFF